MRLVVDTDPGTDDAHAISMAWAHAREGIAGITTVAGNARVEQTKAAALYVIDRLGLDVPVFAGTAAPLLEPHHGALEIHGPDGLAGLVESVGRVQEAPAAVALCTLVETGTVLVGLGALTNLALAMRLDPELPERCGRLVIFGGAVSGAGNFTPVAEFNVASDPEAAEMVFRDWPGITLVPWEAALQHSVSRTEFEAMCADPGPAGTLLRDLDAAARALSLEESEAVNQVLLPDPLAMAVALDPSCVQGSVRHRIHVELAKGPRRGETVVDWNDALDDRSPIEIVTDLDMVTMSRLATV